MLCVCVKTEEGCKPEELAAQELQSSDFIFWMKEVTQRACCLLIDYCAEFFKALHFGVGVLQMSSVQ